MRKIFQIICCGFVMTLTACSGESIEDIELTDTEIGLDSASIIINEYCARSKGKNEFGEKSDWIELYNTGDADIRLELGDWTISDNEENSNKYFIPDTSILAKGYLIIWCDKKDTLSSEIHTNFKLSSSGETIGLYYQGELMDQIKYDSIPAEMKCACRSEDGSSNWMYTNHPSRGKSNQSIEKELPAETD